MSKNHYSNEESEALRGCARSISSFGLDAGARFIDAARIDCVRANLGVLRCTFLFSVMLVILVNVSAISQGYWPKVDSRVGPNITVASCCNSASTVYATTRALVDASIGRVAFSDLKISPDGRYVAFLTKHAIARENKDRYLLLVEEIESPHRVIRVAGYKLAPIRQMQYTAPRPSEFYWSPDSKHLIYSNVSNGKMELSLWNTVTKKTEKVLARHDRINIQGETREIKDGLAIDFYDSEELTKAQIPVDQALRIKDGYRFIGTLDNPQIYPPTRHERRTFMWDSMRVAGGNSPATVSYVRYPSEDVLPPRPKILDGEVTFPAWENVPAPNGNYTGNIRYYFKFPPLSSPNETTTHGLFELHIDNNAQQRLASVTDEAYKELVGWSSDSQELLFIQRSRQTYALKSLHISGRVRTIYEGEVGLSCPGAARSVTRCFQARIGKAVLARSTNLHPEELVAVDTVSGAVEILWSPNRDFPSSNLASVRYISNDHGNSDARLYLPLKGGHKPPFPLVVTLYQADSGFATSTGDEAPIHALLSAGIAVLQFASNRYGKWYRNDPFEVLRVGKPTEAIERLLNELAEKGIVDPHRIGLVGLSYGAEVASYAYWHSNAFAAYSIAGLWIEPSLFYMTGLGYRRRWTDRGYQAPYEPGALENWKRKSIGFNARKDLPPALIQTPDSERYGTAESWVRLREAGSQLEWYDYPFEGHVKEGAANRWWVYTRNLDWFRFWLQDYEDPMPEKRDQYSRWREMRRNLQSAKAEK